MVACFLTRGGYYVYWERGAEVFEEWLVDHETTRNVGNSMWLSCTAFLVCFIVYIVQLLLGRRTSKVRLKNFVPGLEKFGQKYIYKPWKVPIADQKRWGCVIKGDGSVQEEGGMKVYPKPMLDFNETRQICIDKLKKAYAVGMYRDDGEGKGWNMERDFWVKG